MAIEANNIKLYLWRFLKFSVRSAILHVQKYPLSSGMLLFFFLVYLFFPFIFKLLVYSIAILACTAAGVTRYLSSGSAIRKAECFKKGDGRPKRDFPRSKSDLAQDGIPIRRLKKPVISAQMSKRRNFKMKKEDQNHPAEAEIFKPPDDDLLIGKTEEIEETEDPRMIGGAPESHQCGPSRASSGKAKNLDDERGMAVLGKPEPRKAVVDIRSGEFDNSSSSAWGNGRGSTSQLEKDLEEAEDDDEEDHNAQEDGNQAVDWSADDEKNVMDLGLSELERNRRLENLIAKRRARKLMTALRGLPNLLDLDCNAPPFSHMPLVQIPKSNPFDCGPSEETDFQIPGSAPSVLLPYRNPFDIPYDPQEEKPNLTTDDGFQQEFLASLQTRDIFCRHESFTLGPSFSAADIYQEQGLVGPYLYSYQEGHVPRESRLERFKRLADKGDHDRLVEQILYHEHNFSDQDDQEKGSPKEMPKALELGEDRNADTAEEHSGEESSNSTVAVLNLSPQNDVLLSQLDEGDAKLNSSFIPKGSGEGQDSSEMEPNNSSEVPNSPREGSPNASTLSSVNGPFYGSGQCQTIVGEHLDRGMGHSTTYSIASDMQVEVSETGSPRNIPDDITLPPDVIEEDEFRMKEFNDGDRYHQQEDAAYLEKLGMREYEDTCLSIRDLDEEEDSAGKIWTSSSLNTSPEGGRPEDQVGSNDTIHINKESSIGKHGSPDSLEAEIPEEAVQFIDNSAPREVHFYEREEISSSIGTSSSVKIGLKPNDIFDNGNVDENNSGPTQHIFDEDRNHIEQDITPHSGELEEEDINLSGTPLEEANLASHTTDSKVQREEDGEIKSESAQVHKVGEFRTQARKQEEFQ